MQNHFRSLPQILTLLIKLTLVHSAFSQTQQLEKGGYGLMYDLQGVPYYSKKVIETEGTPFFIDAWSTGNVVLPNKRTIKELNVKLNLETNEIHYMTEDLKTEMVAQQGVISEVLMINNQTKEEFRFKCGYPPVGTNTQRTFYLILIEGNVALLKQIKKMILEERPYNSATFYNKYDTKEDYFLYKENKLTKLKRTKSGILEVLYDHRIKLEEFIEGNRINLKSDSDLIRLISFYDSL